MMEPTTQTDEILDYLLEHGSITPMDALNEFGCMRLGARIWDLKHKEDYDIQTVIETKKYASGKVKRYARYILHGNGVQ